jgi:hypothetical protein
MIITCKRVSQTASDFIEGPTTLWQRTKLRLHLIICKHCRRYLRHLRLVIGVTRAMAPREEPTDAEIDALVGRLIQSNSST